MISRLAQFLLSLASYEAIRKRFTRLYASSVARFRKFMVCYFVALCSRVSGRYLHLIFDYTALPLIKRDILVVMVPFCGRGLPVYFEFLPKFSNANFSQNRFEVEFLRRIKKILKRHRVRKRVIVIWDRGFAKGFLFKNMPEGFYFVGRIRKHTGVLIKGKKWVIGETLSVGYGEVKYFRSVEYGLTHRVVCSLVGIWMCGQRGPWWLVSDLFVGKRTKRRRKEWRVIVRIYRERFWIEEGFKDLKNEVPLKDLQFSKNILLKMEKVLVLLMIGYGIYYMVGVANDDLAKRFTSGKWKRGKEKRLSYFKLGLLVFVNNFNISFLRIELCLWAIFSWRNIGRLVYLADSLRL
ncbi:MAG: hypothetical protein ABIL15_00645 [candidate division WOR-3 bacterium]